MAVDLLPLRNVYPTLGTETLGQIATGNAPGPAPEKVIAGSGNGDVEAALTVGGQASPLMGLLVFVGLAAALWWIQSRVMSAEEKPGSIRASATNALIISLVAIAGIPIWKFVFTRFKVPGVSTWVLSV